jgi:hypothetical protein
MTNVSGSVVKIWRRKRLLQIGIEALEREGWTVAREPGGKSSVRRITKGRVTKTVSIRTTQDRHIAFPRNDDDSGWSTLSEVDAVLAVSVDDRESPKFGLVHLIDAEEMRERFDRAYAARSAAGHTMPLGRGIWLSLYVAEPKTDSPPGLVGAGAGLDHPPIAKIPLKQPDAAQSAFETRSVPARETNQVEGPKVGPLTIASAKQGLALHFGVDPSAIKITVEA